MPLEPIPPPSPHGNSGRCQPPPHEHKCQATQPCTIHLSDIGKAHHTFPSGTFRTRYTPPSIPNFVLDYVSAHPFSWSWTTKSGPNKGETFSVLYIPTTCKKYDHHIVRWTVDLFHSFKAHHSTNSLNKDGGVPTPLIHIYQSNMLIQFRRQLAVLHPTPANNPLTTLRLSLQRMLPTTPKLPQSLISSAQRSPTSTNR
jgi:hypothetical protein